MMDPRRAWFLLISASITLIAIATAGGAETAEDDRICVGIAAIAPGELAPSSREVTPECMAPQPTTQVPIVRVNAALMAALVEGIATEAVVPVKISLDDGGNTVRLHPLPSRLNVILVPDDGDETSTSALATLRGPSARLPVGSEGLHLFLGGSNSWLLVRWDTPDPCPLVHDGDPAMTPAFARLGPDETLASTFHGTPEGCPTGAFTFENLGAWTVV